MRKGVAVWPLTADILMDCGNFMLAALNFGTFTCITQIMNSDAHLNPEDILSDKPFIIVEI